MRIIDAMIKQLKLPADIPVARDIVDDGQHLRGLDPARHDAHARRREIPSGGLALQIGFGAGLVYAAQVIVLP